MKKQHHADDLRSFYHLTGAGKRSWLKHWFTGASGACLIFMAAYPFMAAAMTGVFGPISCSRTFGLVLSLNLSGGFIYLLVVSCWVWTAREHLRRGTRFEVTEESLLIKSGISETAVAWNEIYDVFATGSEFVISTQKGRFYFSPHLDDAVELSREIRRRAALADREKTELALCVADGWNQEASFGLICLIAVLMLPCLDTVLMVTFGTVAIHQDTVSLARAALCIAAVVLGLWSTILRRSPIILKVGHSFLSITDMAGNHCLPWSQVRCRRLLWSNYMLVSSCVGWWIVDWKSFFGMDIGKRQRNRFMAECRDEFLWHVNWNREKSNVVA